MREEIIKYLQRILDIQEILLDTPKEKRFGDFSTNIAMLKAKELKKNPKELANQFCEKIVDVDKGTVFQKVEVAGAGFINFFINPAYAKTLLLKVFEENESFGKTDFGKNKKVLIEFVSANPTGPLHIGHGRWAVIGDTLAKIMKKAGFDVKSEFYVNDVGRQVNLLIESVKSVMDGVDIPEEGYQGDYINQIAELAKKEKPSNLKNFVLDFIISSQKKTLGNIGVVFDNWFYEHTLHNDNKLQEVIEKLKLKNLIYQKDGALWFKSEEFGDDKDRVLVRENGEPTYFLSDIAYHVNKFERGFNILINVWGTDHHGYVKRLQAALDALDYPTQNLEIIIGQLVSLYRGKEQIRMSKRTGQMITLQEVIDEIGADATRFFLVMTSADTHIDFDLELAKQKSMDNPVYYVQYAYARICNIIKNSGVKKIDFSNADLSLLKHDEEKDLILKVLDFPNEIKICAKSLQPHHLTRYAKQFATLIHSYYHKHRVISKDENTMQARLVLMEACRITLSNMLKLLGVSAPERM